MGAHAETAPSAVQAWSVRGGGGGATVTLDVEVLFMEALVLRLRRYWNFKEMGSSGRKLGHLGMSFEAGPLSLSLFLFLSLLFHWYGEQASSTVKFTHDPPPPPKEYSHVFQLPQESPFSVRIEDH